ncbi:MAG: segregation and condensation protein A [Ktedonobacteraceae bacterium]
MLDQVSTRAATGHPEEGLQMELPQETLLQETRYVVHLPVFEGPLDLLLHLIEKRQMEITTISLMAVTDQYLAYLQQWEEMTGQAGRPPGSPLHINDDAPSGRPQAGRPPGSPLHVNDDSLTGRPPGSPLHVARMGNMAAFVAIAARLLFIKSQSLLPQTSKDEVTGEMESAAEMAEELQRHLVEYKLAREIANHLRHREEAGLQTYGRSGLLAGIEAQLAWTPPTLLGLEAQSLALAFQRLLDLRAKENGNGAELLPIARVSVSERISEIVSWLSERSSVLLAEVVENEHSRLVIIVTFLAVLEMWKREQIAVKQEMLMGPIVLERGARWEDLIDSKNLTGIDSKFIL